MSRYIGQSIESEACGFYALNSRPQSSTCCFHCVATGRLCREQRPPCPEVLVLEPDEQHVGWERLISQAGWARVRERMRRRNRKLVGAWACCKIVYMSEDVQRPFGAWFGHLCNHISRFTASALHPKHANLVLPRSLDILLNSPCAYLVANCTGVYLQV